MKYEDFNIRITSGAPGAFRVFVSSSMGSGESDMVLPFRPEEAGGVLAGVARSVGGSAQPVLRDLEAVEPQPTNAQRPSVDLGVSLYQAVFRETVQTMLDQCIGRLRDTRDTGIRIRLEMDLHGDGMTQVASLPWELIRRNPTDVPLSVSKRTTVVRALDVMQPPDPKPFEPPLRVLVIVSNPTGTANLKLEDERKRIEESWGKLEGVEVRFVKPTVEAILDAAAAEEIHVIHFMGHGDFDRKTGQGVLILEKPDGSPDPLGSERLKAIFIDEADSLRLVFLNACRTAVSTEDTELDPFAGIATMLIEVGVPAVVAMQFPISDNAAVRFSDTFYRRIVQGMPVDAAVAEGRKALWVDGNPHDEWATPVLFMRSRDGVLFPRAVVTVETVEQTRSVPPKSPAPTASEESPPRGLAAPVPAATGGGRSNWLKIGGGVAGVAVAGMLAMALFSGDDTPELVSSITLEEMPTSMFTAERLERHVQLGDDNRAFTSMEVGQLLAAGVSVLARSEPAGVLTVERASKPVSNDGLAFSIAALSPGSAIVWATAVFPDGDSLTTEPVEISVAEPDGDLRDALQAMDEAWDAALDDDLDDEEVLLMFQDVDLLYRDVLEPAQLEDLDGWMEDMELLIELDITADTITADQSSTVLERHAAAQAYVDSARVIREGHGPAFHDLEAIADALAAQHETHGFANIISLCAGSGSFCAATSATSFEAGQDVTATVWYVVNGTELVKVGWFRDGEPVSTSSTESASRGNQDGYRIRWSTRVAAPGEWQVRVYNSMNQVVGRQQFTVN